MSDRVSRAEPDSTRQSSSNAETLNIMMRKVPALNVPQCRESPDAVCSSNIPVPTQ